MDRTSLRLETLRIAVQTVSFSGGPNTRSIHNAPGYACRVADMFFEWINQGSAATPPPIFPDNPEPSPVPSDSAVPIAAAPSDARVYLGQLVAQYFKSHAPMRDNRRGWVPETGRIRTDELVTLCKLMGVDFPSIDKDDP